MRGADSRRFKTMLMTDWNPTLYSKFEAERMRAARDFCRAFRFPLRVSSMISVVVPATARNCSSSALPMRNSLVSTPPTPCLRTRACARRGPFLKQDIADWAPEDQPDLVFANATLQFLPDHDRLFPRLMSYLAPGGALAAQMPNTANESSHALMRMVAADGPWSSRLVPIAKTQPLIAGYDDYYDWLRPDASQVEVWMTTYVHRSTDRTASPIGLPARPCSRSWSGSATTSAASSRPLPHRLKEAYPVQPDGQPCSPTPGFSSSRSRRRRRRRTNCSAP